MPPTRMLNVAATDNQGSDAGSTKETRMGAEKKGTKQRRLKPVGRPSGGRPSVSDWGIRTSASNLTMLLSMTGDRYTRTSLPGPANQYPHKEFTSTRDSLKESPANKPTTTTKRRRSRQLAVASRAQPHTQHVPGQQARQLAGGCTQTPLRGF